MKRSDVDISSTFYVIMIITGLVVITGGMMQARAILLPLMMATIIAIVSNGPISWFQEKGCPQWLSLFLVLTLFCCVAVLSVLVVGASVKDFLHNIPEYENKLHQQLEHLYAFLGNNSYFPGSALLNFNLQHPTKKRIAASTQTSPQLFRPRYFASSAINRGSSRALLIIKTIGSCYFFTLFQSINHTVESS